MHLKDASLSLRTTAWAKRAVTLLPLVLGIAALPAGGCAVRILGPENAQALHPAQRELRLSAAEIADPLWPETQSGLSVRKVVGILVNGAGGEAASAGGAETAGPKAPVDLWVEEVHARHEDEAAQADALLADMRIKEVAARQFVSSVAALAKAGSAVSASEDVQLVRQTRSRMRALDAAFAALLARLPDAYPAADPAPFLAARTAFARHLAALGPLAEALAVPAQG